MSIDGNTGDVSITSTGDVGWTNMTRRSSTRPERNIERLVFPHGTPSEPIDQKIKQIAEAVGLRYTAVGEVIERVQTKPEVVKVENDTPPGGDGFAAGSTEQWSYAFKLAPQRYFFGLFTEPERRPIARILFSTVRWHYSNIGDNGTSIVAWVDPTRMPVEANGDFHRLLVVGRQLVDETANWLSSIPLPADAAAKRRRGVIPAALRPPGLLPPRE